MSSDALKEIIDTGNDGIAFKYYEVAVATVLFYDYLLTLPDEIRFVWYGKKSWVLVLFFACRYLPPGYLFWVLFMIYPPTMSQRVCDKTAFLSMLGIAGSTVLAQTVLTLRIYAVTGKNRIITACFGAIAISEFVFGLYVTALAAQGAQQPPPIPLDAYRICVFVRHRPLEIGLVTISLVFDFLAFSVIVFLVLRSTIYKFPIPSLLGVIARDATYYFLVIFTSHLVLELTLFFARPTLQLLPGIGNIVYTPVMTTRLMLSLKKASALQEGAGSFGEPTMKTTMGFAERWSFATTRDEIRLDAFASRHEDVQGWA